MNKFLNFMKTSKGKISLFSCMIALFLVIGSICISMKDVVGIHYWTVISDYDRYGNTIVKKTDAPGYIENAVDGVFIPERHLDVYTIKAVPNDFFVFSRWDGTIGELWSPIIRHSYAHNVKQCAYFMPDYDSDLYELKFCEDNALLGIRRTEKKASGMKKYISTFGGCTKEQLEFGYRLTLQKSAKVSTLQGVNDLLLVSVATEQEAIRLSYACAMLGTKCELMELFDGIFYRGAYVAIPVSQNAEIKDVSYMPEQQMISSLLDVSLKNVGGVIVPICGNGCQKPTSCDTQKLMNALTSAQIKIPMEGMRRNICYHQGVSAPHYRYGGGKNWQEMYNDQYRFDQYMLELENVQTACDEAIGQMKNELTAELMK